MELNEDPKGQHIIYTGVGGGGGGGGRQSFILDPNDPFERAVMDIVTMNRKKRKDYSADGSIWWNFDATGDLTGLRRDQVIWVNICQKVNRLRSLVDRKPTNESTIDTKLDLAVYSILLYTESQS